MSRSLLSRSRNKPEPRTPTGADCLRARSRRFLRRADPAAHKRSLLFLCVVLQGSSSVSCRPYYPHTCHTSRGPIFRLSALIHRDTPESRQTRFQLQASTCSSSAAPQPAWRITECSSSDLSRPCMFTHVRLSCRRLCALCAYV